jgi:inosine-uridine nucleoside N-ribohydrolase
MQPAGSNILALIDTPDPDNFVQILALHRLNPAAKIHVAVTGRPVRFKATAEHADWEWDLRSSLMVQQASAARLHTFLERFGIKGTKVYDGGIAPRTPIPHHLHFEDYYKYLDIDPLSTWRYSELEPQEELVKLLLELPEKSVPAAVGGPMTGLNQLIVRNPGVARRLSEVHAMFATWGKVKLMQFDNKPRGAFNVVCDPQAAHFVLCGLTCPIYLMPTEVTRVQAIGFRNPRELQKLLPDNAGCRLLHDLYGLWYETAVKPRQKTNRQERIFIHDLVAAYSLDAALRQQIYKMVPVQVTGVPYLAKEEREWGHVFMRETSSETNIFAATGLTEAGPAIYRNTLQRICA